MPSVTQFLLDPELQSNLEISRTLHVDKFLHELESNLRSPIQLVEPYRSDVLRRKRAVRSALKSALGFARYGERESVRGEWISNWGEVSHKLKRASFYLDEAVKLMPRSMLDSEDKYALIDPLILISRSVYPSISEEGRREYAKQNALKLVNSRLLVCDLSDEIRSHCHIERSERKNPGEPGKAKFALRLGMAWIGLTGRNPPVGVSDSTPFLKFLEAAWIDVGGPTDNTSGRFRSQANKAAKTLKHDPSPLPKKGQI